METIFSYLHQGVGYAVPFIVLLGALIFVHELGHFLVAKYYKVKVEVFSLGFGKKLLSIKRGDTDYCISLVPFGGYVKMFGDDPTAEIPEDMKAVSFNHKPVSQRIAVVLAGPIMNLLFAFILFTAIANLGESVVSPRLGDVPAGTKAYSFGFRSGDLVTGVNQQVVENWDFFNKILSNNKAGKIEVKIKRHNSGAEETIHAETELSSNKDILSDEEHIGAVEGLSFLAQSATIGVKNPHSVAGTLGLQTGNTLTSVNGIKVEYWYEILEAIDKIKDAEKLSLEYQATVLHSEEDKKSSNTSASTEIKTLEIEKFHKFTVGSRSATEILSKLGIDSTEMYVASVMKGSVAEAAGLKIGDRIQSIKGQALDNWMALTQVVRSHKDGDPGFEIKIIRAGEEKTVSVEPKLTSHKNPLTGKSESSFALGILTAMTYNKPEMVTRVAPNFVASIGSGSQQTWHWTKNTVMSFVRLIQNRVSPKSLGGPIMIGQLASETFKIGISPFLKIMAIISINLFILNLLPIPVLDGGHLLFYTIEALRGAPLSLKKLEMAQQVGLVLLLGLMIFALFNDITRVLGFSW